MQQQRYESLKAAIEETRQARARSAPPAMSARRPLQKKGILKRSKPIFPAQFPESRVWSCISVKTGRQTAWSGITAHLRSGSRSHFPCRLDLPECLPVDEIDLCLVLSNLLENALEASLHTAPARRRIELTAYLHGNSLALIQVENTYDGVIREKDGVFLSSKRKGDGVGLQSVRHIAEKILRGEYGYLSGRSVLCKGHALWVIMPCLSKTARPQISAVSLPAIPVCTGLPFLQRR